MLVGYWNKYLSKNRRSGMLTLFPPNLLTRDFNILDATDSFLLVSDRERCRHLSNANCIRGLLVGESNPLRDKPI